MKRLLAFLFIPLPSFIKIPLMRLLFRYKIGSGVKIGLTFFCPGKCQLGDNTKIGHFNFISHMQDLRAGQNVIIGHLNIILGGSLIDIGDGAHIVRSNEINSILKPLALNETTPELIIGPRTIITVGHKIDFTDKITFGESVVFAGRFSNLWTHNRQQVGPISIGRNCYVGSGIQMVANTSVGEYCVVGLGAVITKKLTQSYKIVAGIPAKEIKDLDETSRVLVNYPTRPDLDPVPEHFQ